MASLNKNLFFNSNQLNIVSQKIADQQVGVLPTDTIYGLSASVFSQSAVNKIYQFKKRNKTKPLIVLINSLGNLKIFGIETETIVSEIIKKSWPGPTTIILKAQNKKLSYLWGKNRTLALRWPKSDLINRIISLVGPLVSTSANLEGQPFAKNISEAYKYFGDKVDFYLDMGELEAQPSEIIEIVNGKIFKVR